MIRAYRLLDSSKVGSGPHSRKQRQRFAVRFRRAHPTDSDRLLTRPGFHPTNPLDAGVQEGMEVVAAGQNAGRHLQPAPSADHSTPWVRPQLTPMADRTARLAGLY